MSDEEIDVTTAPESDQQAEPETAEPVIDETTEPEEDKKEDDLPEGVKKRFSKMTSEKYRLKSIIEDQNAKIAKLTEYFESITDTKQEQPDIHGLIEKRANEIIQEQDFNSRCNSTFEKWQQEFGDVSEAVQDLGAVGLSRDILEAIVDSDESAKILQYLSNDLERAEKLSNMRPIKAAKELDKIEAEVKALATKKNKISAVPEPIKPVSGAGSKEARTDLSKPDNYFEWLNSARK